MQLKKQKVAKYKSSFIVNWERKTGVRFDAIKTGKTFKTIYIIPIKKRKESEIKDTEDLESVEYVKQYSPIVEKIYNVIKITLQFIAYFLLVSVLFGFVFFVYILFYHLYIRGLLLSEIFTCFFIGLAAFVIIEFFVLVFASDDENKVKDVEGSAIISLKAVRTVSSSEYNQVRASIVDVAIDDLLGIEINRTNIEISSLAHGNLNLSWEIIKNIKLGKKNPLDKNYNLLELRIKSGIYIKQLTFSTRNYYYNHNLVDIYKILYKVSLINYKTVYEQRNKAWEKLELYPFYNYT